MRPRGGQACCTGRKNRKVGAVGRGARGGWDALTEASSEAQNSVNRGASLIGGGDAVVRNFFFFADAPVAITRKKKEQVPPVAPKVSGARVIDDDAETLGDRGAIWGRRGGYRAIGSWRGGGGQERSDMRGRDGKNENARLSLSLALARNLPLLLFSDVMCRTHQKKGKRRARGEERRGWEKEGLGGGGGGRGAGGGGGGGSSSACDV